jgi:hypothetical protein
LKESSNELICPETLLVPNGINNVDDASLDHHLTLRGPTFITNFPDVLHTSNMNGLIQNARKPIPKKSSKCALKEKMKG